MTHRLPLLLFAGLLGIHSLLPGQDPKAQPAQEKKQPVMPLSKAATEALVSRYQNSEHWLQKAVILLTLQEWWAPAGAKMLTEAFKDKDRRLSAFALEALLRSDPELLPMVTSNELLQHLIDKQLDRKNSHFRSRLLLALTRIAPEVEAKSKGDWESWWRKTKETWQPKTSAWKPREVPEALTKGGTVSAVDRAFDLYRYGLDMVLCIDSTGSMQPTIDAIKTALDQMVDLVDGLSPKFRLGIVHYKDEGNLGSVSAKNVQSLTKGVKKARRVLSKLRAGGGNASLPEHMLDGIKVSFDSKMRWDKNANKVLVVIGDAPCLDGQLEPILDLVGTAQTNPSKLSVNGRPTTGRAKAGMRPFITACIGIRYEFSDAAKAEINKTAGGQDFLRRYFPSRQRLDNEMPQIAKAGGGSYQTIVLKQIARSEMPEKPKKKKRRPSKRPSGQVPPAIRNTVSHILVLSFGKSYAAQMRDFTRIYFEYKADKLFR